MAYKAFEGDPSLEFDFFLADRLKTTVAEMRETMSADEWLHWSIYHGRVAQKRELGAQQAAAKAKKRG